MSDFIANKSQLNYLNNHWIEVAPSLLDYAHLFDNDVLKEISNKIRHRYFGNGLISDNVQALIEVSWIIMYKYSINSSHIQ